MAPKPVKQDDGKEEIVSAFKQLSSALNNAARVVETYTGALSKGGISVLAAGESYASALLALHGGSPVKSEGTPVAGKKRGRPSAAGDDLEGGKRRRRMKKEKDPNAPKRPASAYLLYQNDKRAEFVEKFKELPYHEMLTKISESWSKLADPDKKPYLDAQAKLKEEYQNRKSAYEISKTAPVAAAEEEEEEEDDELEAEITPPTKATNGEVESEDDDDEEEEEEAMQVDAVVAKSKADDEDEDEDEDEEEEEDDDESETSEDEEPPRKKTKGSAPPSATKKTPVQAAKPASKPSSKKAAAPAALSKEKKKRKGKD